jgi:hypothetical protein
VHAALWAIEEDPTLSLSQIGEKVYEETGDRFDISTISRRLKRVGLVRKSLVPIKPSWNKAHVRDKRHEFVIKFREAHERGYVFCEDEAALNTALKESGGKGWTMRGERPLQFVPDSRGDNRTLLAGESR